ncbi:MAG: type II toxin-antitoxin system VapC family toxin [Fibrobacterota bacterium]|nr:type II toxin-antitoxin system VapC family toxin [Chitinispirillaceae bacterium]
MIFDTDVLIWVQRGNENASKVLESVDRRFISAVTFMELLQNAQNKKQQTVIKEFLHEQEFIILPISENISHRALIYIEEYSLSHGITFPDALIAATSNELCEPLLSGNYKHYKAINDLDFHTFKP